MFPFFGVKGCAHSKVDSPSSGSNHDDLCPGLVVSSEFLITALLGSSVC